MADQVQQPKSELASLGEELRRERELRGISLKEIADATKISSRSLDALERNDHRILPAPVFTRGFVKEYARYLGLNAEELVNRYNYAAAGDDRIEKSPHLDRLVQPPPEDEPAVRAAKKKSIPPPYARIDRNVYFLAVIIVALVGVAVWAVRLNRKQAATDHAVETASIPIATPPPNSTLAPDPTPPPDPNVLRLTIELTDDSWVSLEADGKVVMNDEMKRGAKANFEAREAFRFRTIGNAAGLALTLNEIKIPPLGREGQVIKNRVFDHDTLDGMKQPESRGDA